MDASIPESDASANAVEPLLVTAEHAATSLSICRTKVYELLRNGELESVRIGTSRRIPAARWPGTSSDCELDKQFQRMRGRCIRPFSDRDGATETANWETWT